MITIKKRVSIEYLSKTEQDKLKKIQTILTEKLSPIIILYFGDRTTETVIRSCFRRSCMQTNWLDSYDLLLVSGHKNTESPWTMERIAEDACRSLARLNLICLTLDEFENALNQGNYFYLRILHKGVFLLGDQYIDRYEEKIKRATAIKYQAILSQEAIPGLLQKAESALGKAEKAYDQNNPYVCTMQLHDAVEWILKVIIIRGGGIHPETHDLRQLARTSYFFTQLFYETFSIDRNDDAIIVERIESSDKYPMDTRMKVLKMSILDSKDFFQKAQDYIYHNNLYLPDEKAFLRSALIFEKERKKSRENPASSVPSIPASAEKETNKPNSSLTIRECSIPKNIPPNGNTFLTS